MLLLALRPPRVLDWRGDPQKLQEGNMKEKKINLPMEQLGLDLLRLSRLPRSRVKERVFQENEKTSSQIEIATWLRSTISYKRLMISRGFLVLRTWKPSTSGRSFWWANCLGNTHLHLPVFIFIFISLFVFDVWLTKWNKERHQRLKRRFKLTAGAKSISFQFPTTLLELEATHIEINLLVVAWETFSLLRIPP